MPMTDPIADMLTRIRNAQKAEHPRVSVPTSKVKERIASVLQAQGYIAGFDHSGEGVNSKLIIELKYYHGDPVIESIKRVSKPGRRVYSGFSALPLVNGGLGIAIVSTSKGIMTAKEAESLGIGGEILCTVS